jgi:hypothetical protein
MANRICSVLLAGVLLDIAGVAEARSFFVDKASVAQIQDGSLARPFHTITRALIFARMSRELGALFDIPYETINIHVAPERYVGTFGLPLSFDTPQEEESLPLILNIPDLALQGALRFDSAGQVVPGTETSLRATKAPSLKEHMVLVVGDHVTISGFLFDGMPTSGLQAVKDDETALLSIDRVSRFLVSGNVVTRSGTFGITTRFASGSIANNHFIDNVGVGINVTAGSNRYPAVVEIVGNEVRHNGVGGIGLQGAAQTERDVDQFEAQGLQQSFPPEVKRPNDVPDKLDVSVRGNNVTDNGNFGIQVNGYIRDYYRLLPPDVDLTASVRARFVGNVSSSNGNYGVVVTAGQIDISKRRENHTVNLDVAFDSTTLDANGSGPALFGFWHIGPSNDTAKENSPNFRLANDSTITICGDITQFSFDNRAVDPVKQTATNNALTVNTMPLTGFCVPLHENCVFKMPALPCH